MDEHKLLQSSYKHARPYVDREPLLKALVDTARKDMATSAHLKYQNPADYAMTADEQGKILVEYYIERLTAAERILPNADEIMLVKDRDHIFANLVRITGLTEEECKFLISQRIQKYDDLIEM